MSTPIKKKILFVITQSELGGAQRWLLDTASNINKELFDVVVAAGGNGPLFESLQKDNIRTHRLTFLDRNINPFKEFFGIAEIYHLAKKEAPYALQLCSTKAGLIGAIAGRLAGVPKIIYRIGGWTFNDPRPRWQNKIFLWLEKLSAPLKDKIIVNSQNNFDQALRLKICPKEKLHLLYNGIKTSTNGRPLVSGDVVSKKAQEKFVIGTIANFYPTKGLQYLIEAAALMRQQALIPNDNFLILIIGDGRQRHLLEQLIAENNLDKHIELIGAKSDPWTYLIDRGLDIFVLVSVKEGMPYVLLEAMDHGLPIITTNVGGVTEIIHHQTNGLVIPPSNPKALAEAVKNLINNPELKEQLAKQASIDINRYSLEKMIRDYEQILLKSQIS